MPIISQYSDNLDNHSATFKVGENNKESNQQNSAKNKKGILHS